MFGNFIYFIIVLLIFSIYQPPDKAHFSLIETLYLFISLFLISSFFTWIQFHKLAKRISEEKFNNFDQRLDQLLTRQSVLALVVIAADIYWLNLSSFFIAIPLLSESPTLQALIFLLLFIIHMSINWACAHKSRQKLGMTELSGRSYIISNISFCIPIILPWLLLSGCIDIINALPFDILKKIFSTTEGEIIFFLVFLFTVALFGPGIILKIWRCKPLEEGYYRNKIDALCKKAHVEYADILYWPIFEGQIITAGVMGLIKRFRYILVTKALLNLLDPDEIEAVISHEIGHIKKKHLLFYLVFFAGYIIFSYALFDLIVYLYIYSEPILKLANKSCFDQSTVISSIFTIVTVLLFVIYFRYIFGFYMRNFERQADIYTYSIFNSGKPLISSFLKIAQTSATPPDKPNWHHFSIKERIDYLIKCENDRTFIEKHEKKVKKSIALYLAGILIAGAICYELNFGATGEKIDGHLIKTIIKRQIVEDPSNPDLFEALGNLYYSRKEYKEAITAYQQSINFNQDNPEVLNNIAWLLATCGDVNLRDPKRSLMFAKRAVALKKEPHIFDTLAESYYISGMYLKAVEAETYALELAQTDRNYYKKQLEKYKKAGKAQEPDFDSGF